MYTQRIERQSEKFVFHLALDLSLKSFMFRVETNKNINYWMESLERPEKSKTEYFAD